MPSYDPNLFNVDPYYDDYSENKKHLRIMFRPGYGVQARELTQMQTILQNQIERFGSHIFDDGSIVLDGQITENLLRFAKLQISGPTITHSDLIGTTIHNATVPNGAYGKIVHAEGGVSGDPNTVVFFEYVIGGSGFAVNNSLTGSVANGNSYTATITGQYPLGNGIVVSVDRGVRFVDGFFVLNTAQSIGAYSLTGNVRNYSNPTTSVGFDVVRSFAGSENDTSLNDPAFGYYNYAAPGADRYIIDLKISQKGYTATDTSATDNFSREGFIEFMRIVNGDVVKTEKYPDYAMLEDTLARRTYDESGNYTVYPFDLTMRGVSGDDTILKAEIGPGKAYIFGYEFENQASVKLSVDKARTTRTVLRDFNRGVGPYVKVTVSGITGCFAGVDDIGKNPTLLLVTGPSGDVGTGQTIKNVVGTARMRRLEKYISPVYYLSLYDITLTAGAQFSDVDRIYIGGITNGNRHAFAVNGSSGLENVEETSLLWEIPDGYVVDSINSADYAYTNYHTETVSSYPHTFTVNPPNYEGYQQYTSLYSEIPIPSDDVIVMDSNGVIMSGTAAAYGARSMSITVQGNSSNTNKLFVMANVDVQKSNGFNGSNYIRSKAFDYANITLTGEFASLTGNGRGSTSDTLYFNGIVDGIILLGLTGRFNDGSPNDRDLKPYFSFDGGQRDHMYDWSRVTMMGNSPASGFTGPYSATIGYYRRTSANNYGPFTMKSYDSDSTKNFGGGDYIPMYISPASGRQYYLRDCIDYRPDRGPTSSVNSLSGHAWIPTNTPANDNEYEYTHYLPRTDKIVLTRDRTFVVIKGIPSLEADIPPDNPNAMSLYTVRLNPFTFNAEDVNVRMIENKRYTMRDIGELEKRIEAVEYYTTLNILEQDAKAISIRDEMGNEMPKRGILVDQFKGHVVADNSDSMFAASIDPETNELRPAFDSYAFSLTGLNEGTSLGPNWDGLTGTKEDGIYLLDYTPSNEITNIVSSDEVSINPFSVVSYLGTIKAQPSSDFWYSTEYSPVVRVNVEGENDNWYTEQVSLTGGGKSPYPSRPGFVTGGPGNFKPRNSVPPRIRPGSISPVPGTSEPTSAMENPGYKVPGFGTRYNDWETLWFGKDVVADKSNRPNALYSNSLDSKANGISVNSINSSLVPESINKKTRNKVVSKDVVLRARKMPIKLTAKGLRPSSTFHVFCDDVYVTPFCEGQTLTDSKGEITNLTFYFNRPSTNGNYGEWEQNFGVGKHVIRIISTDKQVLLNGYNSGGQSLGPNWDGDIDPETLAISPELWVASADFTYMAEGNYDSLADYGILSTRLPSIERKSSKSAVVVSNTSELITSTGEIKGYAEPLSQVFYVDPNKYPSGMFVPYVDLYFKRKDSSTTIPVTVKLKPCISGYPHPSQVMPFGTSTLYSNLINVSDRVESGNSNYTRFSFSTPVYLLPGQEYAISINSNSSQYSLHTSTVGSFATKEEESDPDLIITKQPNYRSLIKTQNTGKMMKNDNEVLCSRIGVCKFDDAGTLKFGGADDLYEGKTNFDFNLMRVNCSHISPEGTTVTCEFAGSPVNMNKNITPDGGVYAASDNDTLDFILERGSDPYVSPVVDLERTNLLLVKNIVNNNAEIDPEEETYSGELEGNNSYAAEANRAYSRYITKRITLESGIQAENITVKMSLCNPIKNSTTDSPTVQVFVRAIPSGTINIDDVKYTPLTSSDLGYSLSDEDFREVSFTNIGNTTLPKFESFMIKVVMLGSQDGSSFPRIRNLRIVAT